MTVLKHMKYNKILWIIPLFVLNFGCTREPIDEPDTDLTEIPDDPDTQIRDFIWEAMNSWYLYQADQPGLADTQDDVISEYVGFLQGFDSPESFFDGLLYQPNVKDRFSFIMDDYEE